MIYNSYQIAEIMNVNVSTVKRLTDSGKLKCQKTDGGHRKFHINDLKDFLKKNEKHATKINLRYLVGTNKALTNAIKNKDNKKLINYCFKSLISENPDEFIKLNNALMFKGYSLEILFDEIIIPALIRIGQEWVDKNLLITEEHLATERIKKFMFNLISNAQPKKTKYNAFCFTLADDKHDLPTYMAEIIINQNKNIKTFNLGPDLPIKDFIKLSKKVIPKIIFISIVYTEKISTVKKEIDLLCKTFNNQDVKIFLSGNSAHNIGIKKENLIYIKSFEELNQNISNIS